MKHGIKLVLATTLCMIASNAIAITMPAPPPELPDTLTKFRTQEQINEGKTIENETLGLMSENVEIESAPFVPGDVGSGIVRLAAIYSPDITIGVPDYGASLIRFFDLQGVPWEISSVRCEAQGFLTEVTASPSELLIKQNVGATTTKMIVELTNYDSPLVFHLSPVKLEREGVAINTIINTIRIRSYTDSQGYVYPTIHEVPKSNPNAQLVKFDADELLNIENNLIDAVRGIKQNDAQ